MKSTTGISPLFGDVHRIDSANSTHRMLSKNRKYMSKNKAAGQIPTIHGMFTFRDQASNQQHSVGDQSPSKNRDDEDLTQVDAKGDAIVDMDLDIDAEQSRESQSEPVSECRRISLEYVPVSKTARAEPTSNLKPSGELLVSPNSSSEFSVSYPDDRDQLHKFEYNDPLPESDRKIVMKFKNEDPLSKQVEIFVAKSVLDEILEAIKAPQHDSSESPIFPVFVPSRSRFTKTTKNRRRKDVACFALFETELELDTPKDDSKPPRAVVFPVVDPEEARSYYNAFHECFEWPRAPIFVVLPRNRCGAKFAKASILLLQKCLRDYFMRQFEVSFDIFHVVDDKFRSTRVFNKDEISLNCMVPATLLGALKFNEKIIRYESRQGTEKLMRKLRELQDEFAPFEQKMSKQIGFRFGQLLNDDAFLSKFIAACNSDRAAKCFESELKQKKCELQLSNEDGIFFEELSVAVKNFHVTNVCQVGVADKTETVECNRNLNSSFKLSNSKSSGSGVAEGKSIERHPQYRYSNAKSAVVSHNAPSYDCPDGETIFNYLSEEDYFRSDASIEALLKNPTTEQCQGYVRNDTNFLRQLVGHHGKVAFSQFVFDVAVCGATVGGAPAKRRPPRQNNKRAKTTRSSTSAGHGVAAVPRVTRGKNKAPKPAKKPKTRSSVGSKH